MKLNLLLLSLLYLLISVGALHITPQTNHLQFFDKQAQELVSLHTLSQQYGSTDGVQIVLVSDSESIISPVHIGTINTLQTTLQALPHLETLQSLLTQTRLTMRGFSIAQTPIIHPPYDSLDLEQLQKINAAFSRPFYRGMLIDSSVQSTSINLTFSLSKLSEEQRGQLRDTIKSRVTTSLAGSNLRFFITGGLYIDEAFTNAGIKDSHTLTPLMVILFIGLIALLYRSFSVVLAFSLTVFSAPLLVMGIAGWLGVAFSPTLAIVPIITLTIATATAIHLLSAYQVIINTTSPTTPSVPLKALVDALHTSKKALLFTAITTIVGFLTLNLSKTRPFRIMGNLAALGTAIAFLHARFLLPQLLTLFKLPRIAPPHQWVIRLQQILFTVVTKHALLVVSLFTLLLLATLTGLFHLTPNDEFTSYFDSNNSFKQSTDSAVAHLGGIDYLQMSLKAPTNAPHSIADSAYLDHLSILSNEIAASPLVRTVISLPLVIEHYYGMMTLPRPFQNIPYSMSKMFVEKVSSSSPNPNVPYQRVSLVSKDQSSSQILIVFNPITSTELIEFSQHYTMRAQQLFHEKTIVNSTSLLFAQLSVANARQMNRGMLLSLILITLLLWGVTQRFRYASITIIPNALPILVSFGLWGLFVGKSGLGLSIVAPMSLGIIVDDTVHFITHYSGYRGEGLSVHQALKKTFAALTSPVLATTLVLSLGFLMLTFSGFAPTMEMGIVTTITVILALVGDLLLLPALLVLFDKKS